MKNKIEFPKVKKIDYREFIQPKKQVFVTKNNIKIAILKDL